MITITIKAWHIGLGFAVCGLTILVLKHENKKLKKQIKEQWYE